MAPDRRLTLLAVAVLALVLVAAAAFFAAFAFVNSETTVESTVVTTQTGNATPSGDSVVLVTQGDERFADRVETRLRDQLSDAGYSVAVAEEPGGHQGPVLVVDVTRADVDPGITARSANLTVESYYAVPWNQTTYEQYSESGELTNSAPNSTVVAGEHQITDTDRGIGGNYRDRLARLMAETVAESFRGDLSD